MKARVEQLVWMLVAEAAAGADVSLDERYQILSEALREAFGNDDDGCPRFYVQEVFPEYIIARASSADKLFRIGYTINADGSFTMAAAQEVEQAYVPVSEAGSFLPVSEADGAEPNDCVYRVAVMRAGWSRNTGTSSVSGDKLPLYYPVEFVGQVAEACSNGAKFGRFHPRPVPGGYQNGEDDPTRIAGWYSDGRVVGNVAEANLNLLASEADMRSKLSAARKAGKLDLFGLSILGTVGFGRGVVEGKPALIAKQLGKMFSIDLVAEAGAGGGFLELQRVAASAAASHDIAALQASAVREGSSVQPGRRNHGDLVNKLLVLRVIEALRSTDAAKAATFETELNAAPEDKYGDIHARVSEALTSAAVAAGAAAQAAADATLAEVKKLQFVNVMEAALTESKLPEPAKKLVREHFAVAEGTKEALDTKIVSVREAFAAASSVGRVTGIASVWLDSEDKLQLAMDRMLGVREAASSGIPAFKGIKHAYIAVTGDRDLQGFTQDGGFRRVSEAVASADFPNLLLNSLTKKLLQGWADLGMAGLDQLYVVGSPTNYLLQDRVRDGYFNELPVVAEGAPYTEIAKPTDERVNYAIANRGNLLTISEQTIRNDNLGAIARWPDKLVRAGLKTLKTYISSFYVNNTAYQADGVNWFDAGHGNLLAMVFGYDALKQAEINLFTQTEKDSSEQLGFTLDWLMVPIQLKAAACELNQTNTAGANSFFQRFGANNERIIVNEKLTDTNDWFYGTSKDNAPCLEIGFLDGIQQPQIFLANNPLTGTAFTNDQIQYKVKHSFGGAIIDYRGTGKSVNA